eukprot:TRINITY_DN30968_c0_g1_i1.p1 TRINITY_DN30968_c0_g1~~TRINITY_DN30968_c0_g1_i1.p1  ORF type:complete len:304 (+),score=79.25 TRINITY_DN30968_c0_g1_i1:116-913(+)
MYHPDRNSEGEQLFKEVSAAYEILGNEDRRNKYDSDVRSRNQAAAVPLVPDLSSEILAARTKEDEERKKRREPISAYLFVGKEKELFDEQLQRDAESTLRRKQSAKGNSSYNIRTLAHNNNMRNEEENKRCQQQAKQRQQSDIDEQNRLAQERESRMKNLEKETREEWERELLRMEVEKQRTDADRTLREQATQRQQELEQTHFDNIMAEHRRQADQRRKARQLSEHLCKDLSDMTISSLEKIKSLLRSFEASIDDEISSRQQSL